MFIKFNKIVAKIRFKVNKNKLGRQGITYSHFKQCHNNYKL